MLESEIILDFARQHFGVQQAAEIRVCALRGGLESEGISRICAFDSKGRETATFVAKPLRGQAIREYELHKYLDTSGCYPVSPRVLGWQRTAQDEGYLFFEWIASDTEWPWQRAECSAMVLEQLARVHTCDSGRLEPLLSAWDYDADLAESAVATIQFYEHGVRIGGRVGTRPMVRPLRRITEHLSAIRQQLANFTGRALLHGDAHPGNVILRASNGVYTPVLVDWARCRMGSPLEDVCSWVHSLGFWEPEARRVHDSLLIHYRRVRGEAAQLSPTFRQACWLAGACNALAGALRYHLAVSGDPERTPEERWTSARAATDWLRIIRRADLVWRNG